MWFIILLVLAAVAYLIVKGVKAQTEKKQAEADRLAEGSGLEGSLSHDNGSRAENNNETTAPTNVSAASVAGVAAAAVAGLNSGNKLQDAQEMIKILNLAETDASRLSISKEQFGAIRQGAEDALPGPDQIDEVVAKLRNMLT